MTHPTNDEGVRQLATVGSMGATQNPRGFNRVTIEVDVWAGEGAHASAWAVAENVEISMRNACDAVAKEIACPESGIEVIVR